jgi:hypothetical protein
VVETPGQDIGVHGTGKIVLSQGGEDLAMEGRIRLTGTFDDYDAQVGPATEGEIDGEDGHGVTLRPELRAGQG